MAFLSRVTSILFFNTAANWTVRSLVLSPNLTRPQFLSSVSSTCLSLALESSSSMENTAISLLDSVYGPVDSPDFPLPMPEGEAGLCAVDGQRRYLWTDAFAVLAFLSISDSLEQQGRHAEAAKYSQAVKKLMHVVHNCLGTPRSPQEQDAMQKDESSYSPTGYVGLRIGKVDSRPVTDYGMQYDGQYWHYVDKWLLALARAGHVQDGIRIAKSCFPFFFDKGEDGTGRNGGIRWKLSIDASAPPSLQRAHVSDDTLVALIVFSILEGSRTPDMPSLADEISMLKNALRGYTPRDTDDPLGWGLEAMYDQFIQGHPRERALASLQTMALHESHLSLPFRLYGAMIGARIAGERVAPPQTVERLIQLSIEHEKRAADRGYEEHSSINRVMLAMCILCPGALERRPDDPLISF